MGRDAGLPLARIEALYRERFEQFTRVAAAVAGDAESGRDAVQLGFAAAVRARRTFRGTGSPEGWIWCIVVNEAKRLARAPRFAPLDEAGERAAEPAAQSDLWLRRHLAALPERQRQVLFLRYFADLDYRAIAQVLGVEVGTVSATLNAAHAKLRAALKEEVER